MKVELNPLKVKDITENYCNYNFAENEEGSCYNGKLIIKKEYCHSLIYNNEKRNNVIDSVINNHPLNAIYLLKSSDNQYDFLDGQQRIISICSFVASEFSIEIGNYPVIFHNLSNETQDKILNYELITYFCSGTPKEILDWVKRIKSKPHFLTESEICNRISGCSTN